MLNLKKNMHQDTIITQPKLDNYTDSIMLIRVKVQIICNNTHVSLNTLISKFRPWSLCSSKGHPNLPINPITKDLATTLAD